jgi:hypothetical protein
VQQQLHVVSCLGGQEMLRGRDAHMFNS